MTGLPAEAGFVEVNPGYLTKVTLVFAEKDGGLCGSWTFSQALWLRSPTERCLASILDFLYNIPSIALGELYRPPDLLRWHCSSWRSCTTGLSLSALLPGPEVEAMSNPAAGGGNLPLQEFRREIPPGWAPGDSSYPLKLYMEKLQLWYKTTTLEDEVVGPMVAGRLHGRAAQVAMTLRVPRPDGAYDVGPEALSRLSVDEVLDPVTGAVVQQPIASGVQYLITALRQTFGQQDQDLATNALDKFFSLSRTSQKMTLAEYAMEFDVRYDEAHDRAGLQLNDVGKFYIWFKHSGLSPKTVDDIKLQVGGDYTRFQDARSLALRMSPNHPTSEADIFYEDWAEDGYYDDDYEDELAWWYGYGGYDNDENYWDDYDQYYDDYDDGHYYWDDEYGWFEEQLDGEAQQPDAAEDDPSRQSEDPQQADAQGDYYKGKSKGKGGEDGCFNCGSKWHMAHGEGLSTSSSTTWRSTWKRKRIW